MCKRRVPGFRKLHPGYLAWLGVKQCIQTLSENKNGGLVDARRIIFPILFLPPCPLDKLALLAQRALPNLV